MHTIVHENVVQHVYNTSKRKGSIMLHVVCIHGIVDSLVHFTPCFDSPHRRLLHSEQFVGLCAVHFSKWCASGSNTSNTGTVQAHLSYVHLQHQIACGFNVLLGLRMRIATRLADARPLGLTVKYALFTALLLLLQLWLEVQCLSPAIA